MSKPTQYHQYVKHKSVNWLIKNRYNQASYSKKAHAIEFAKAWAKKGYKISAYRSRGPQMEGVSGTGWYVKADKPKRVR